MKRLTPPFNAVNTEGITLKSSFNKCERKDDNSFWLCYGNIGHLTIFFDIAK
jgi:hypothetical protein